MSSKSTFYKSGDENGGVVHIYEEMLGDKYYKPGLYVRVFVPHRFDIVVPITQEQLNDSLVSL